MKLSKILAIVACLNLLNSSTGLAKLYWNGSSVPVSSKKITKFGAYKRKLNRRMVKTRQRLGVEYSVTNQEVRSILAKWASDHQIHRFSNSIAAIEKAIKLIDPKPVQLPSHQIQKPLSLIDKMSNGQHSFRNLGSEFFVACEMEKIPAHEAKLVFFNEDLANKLGLELPNDHEKLEQIILDKFAVMTKECGDKFHSTPGTMFATRYMDSAGKDPLLHAQGDGRVVWSGEIKGNINGHIKSLDVVLKGVGKTSLEWLGHTEASHKDGLQSTREGVHSYIISKINQRNQIDSTQDLAVIELSNKIKHDEKYGEQPPTITVRIGQQVRMGHLSYWADQSDKYEKILRYSVNRALNRPISDAITPKVIHNYLNVFVKNLAIEAARYEDLLAMHGSLTRGNRTTEGLSIDNGTWQYLDGFHADYKSVGGTLAAQKKGLKDYISDFFNYTKAGNIDLYIKISGFQKPFETLFDKIYSDSLVRMTLKRIGYTSGNITQILESNTLSKRAKELAAELNRLTREQFELYSHEESNVCGKSIEPARYDMRVVLTSIVKFLETNQFKDVFTDDSWIGYEDSILEQLLQRDKMTFWANVARNDAIKEEISRLRDSDIFLFAKQLADFQRDAASYLNIALESSETEKINGLKRVNAKTGTYILEQFKLKSEQATCFADTKKVSKSIEELFVEKGILETTMIPEKNLQFLQLVEMNSISSGDSTFEVISPGKTTTLDGRVDSSLF